MSELSSKVQVIETAPSARTIAGTSTAVFGMVGIAERGPIGTPTLITSLANYIKVFGSYLAVASAQLAQAVAGFFAEGSGQLWVVRTAHYTDTSDPTTITAERAVETLVTAGAATPARAVGGSAPFSIATGSTIVFSVDGGGDLTATFTGVAEQRKSGAAWPLDMADGQTLTVALNGGAAQTIVFAGADALIADIDAVTLAEATAVIGRDLVGALVWNDGADIFIQSEVKGTSSAVITGGTAPFVFAESVAGSGNVATLAAVTAAEVEAIVEAASVAVVVDVVDGDIRISTVDTGVDATLQIKAGSADAFGFTEAQLYTGAASGSVDLYTVEGKDPGTYANGIVVAVVAATSGEAGRFNLTVTRDGVVRETWPNLSPDPDDARYAIDIINSTGSGSNLIRLTDLDVVDSPRPANQSVTLADGDDGLTSLADADFIGASSEDGRTGLRALDLVGDLAVVAIPGRASATIATGLLAYCDGDATRRGEVFAVIDVPANLTRTEVVTWVETTASILNASEQGAVYWPWVKVANPSAAVFGNASTITVAPSGVVMGMMARGDSARPGGVYDPPAGIETGLLRSALGVEDDAVLEEATRDLIYPKRINPITTSPGLPYHVDGSRTLKGTGNFPNINERRGVNAIKRSVRTGLNYVRFRRHDASLRASVRRTVNAYLTVQMQRGAFRSADPETAFSVVCDDTNNSLDDVIGGRLNVDILLATAKPTEFVTISVSQDTRQ